MLQPKAPRDAVAKRKGFYIMRNKNIAASIQPDGTGIQFIYLSDGRIESSANIIGNITDKKILRMVSSANGFKQLVHSIGVTLEMEEEY